MRKVVTTSLSVAVLVGLGWMSQTPTQAAEIEWTNTSGGTFSVGTNWGDGSAPDTSDSALFDKPNTYQVDFDADATNTALTVTGGTVTFGLDGNTYTQTGMMGVEGTNTLLNIRDGTLTSRYARTGKNAGSLATAAVVNVSGIGSQWNISGSSTSTAQSAIGYEGNGKLQINDQGAVSVTSANTTGTNFTVGYYGNGELDIDSQGTMTTGDNIIFIIAQQNKVGNVTVEDAGSKLTVGKYLYVGYGGKAALTVQNGGQVQTPYIFAGYNLNGFTGTTGQITVTSGGDLNITQDALIGGDWSVPQAAGTLTVGDHGTVEVSGTARSLRVYTLGTVELQGDSTITTPKMDVWGGKVEVSGTNNDIVGNAIFTTDAGGTVNSTLNFTLAAPTPSGDGGLLSVSGALTLGGILNVSLADGFTPVLGDKFDLLDWGSLAGSFATVSLPTLSDPQLTWYQGDLYTDGTIAVAAVPEPGVLGLLAMGGLALMARRHRMG